jgi:hypothetical protein
MRELMNKSPELSGIRTSAIPCLGIVPVGDQRIGQSTDLCSCLVVGNVAEEHCSSVDFLWIYETSLPHKPEDSALGIVLQPVT